MDMIPHSSSNGKRGLAAFAALILTCVLLIGTLSTVQAAPPSAFTRISTNAGDNTSLSMSADGTVITFAEPAQIVVSKNGGALVSASSGLNNTAFPYSPASGSWLAYFATGVFPNSGIFKYSVSGGTKAIVITSNLQSKAAIDNNGNVIAYQTTSDGRYYINGTFTGITATPETNGTKPVCDATGTYVAFRANSTTYVFATANPTVVLYSKAATVGTNDDVPSIVLASVGGSLNWLTCQTSNDSSIKRFKLEDGTGAADFTGANEPAALSADGKFLAAKSSSSNNILIFDAVTRVVVGTIAGLPNPTEIAIANGGGKVSFVTTAKLVAGDTGTNKDVYVWNNVAPIASNQSVSTYEDNTSIPFTLEVSHLVSEGQALTYTVGTYPSKGTLSIALNNYVQIGSTPPSMTYIPFADATGADSFTYTVTDPLGGSSTATVSINIIPLNDAPTIAPIADTSTRFDTPISVDVTVNDIDSPINSLVVTATSSNQAIVKDSNIVASGTGTARSLTITPELTAPSGDVTITVTVTDDVGAFASTQFKLTVISQQPDASVRPSTTPDFIGDGIINLTGTGQTVGLTVATSVATTYYVMVKNTGSNADTFVITGPAAPAGWTAVYKDSLGAVITNAVTHAGWTTAALASGETTTIEVIVTPGATREGGTMAELAITATSVTSPTQQDVVKVQTTVASTFLTDLSLRTSISAVYSGIDIYNLDGTGQTVGLNVSKNSLVSYFVHVQNKGNAPDTFNITATPIPAGWTVVYKVNNSTGLDITADVTSSGWTTPTVAPGALVTIAVYIVAGSTVPGSTTVTQTVTATSVGDAAKQDVGLIQTTTVPNVYKTDLSLRSSKVATYAGIGIFNLDGTDQTVGQTAVKNKIVSYFIHVQNKGNAPDTFTITGTAAPAGWSVVYKINNTNGTIITDDVTGAGWITPLLNPNGLVTVAVYIIPGSTAGGSMATQTVTATSNGDASKQDVGVINTTVN